MSPLICLKDHDKRKPGETSKSGDLVTCSRVRVTSTVDIWSHVLDYTLTGNVQDLERAMLA